MCSRIKYFVSSLHDATKNVKFVQAVPKKTNGSATNNCDNRNAVKLWRLLASYRRWFVVVHAGSCFSLRSKMAPLYSTKFQIAYFLIFCARITVIFRAMCTHTEVCSLVVMGIRQMRVRCKLQITRSCRYCSASE